MPTLILDGDTQVMHCLWKTRAAMSNESSPRCDMKCLQQQVNTTQYMTAEREGRESVQRMNTSIAVSSTRKVLLFMSMKGFIGQPHEQ